MMTLKDLAADHPYYANQANYYSNDCYTEYDFWNDFHREFNDADIDMNLCFRFDIEKQHDEDDNELDKYQMKIIIIGQRKGLYLASFIKEVTEDDVPSIVDYLQKHYKRIQENWEPFNLKEIQTQN